MPQKESLQCWTSSCDGPCWIGHAGRGLQRAARGPRSSSKALAEEADGTLRYLILDRTVN